MSEQYFANNRKVGDGVTTVWDFSFAGARPDAGDGTKTFLEQTDIRVALVDYDSVGLESRTEITFELIGPSQVLVEPAVPSGQDFVIYRKTQSSYVISDFVDFASISERDLDDAFRQGLYAVQELRDESSDTRRDANIARRDTAAALDVISEITGSEEPLRELVRKADLEAGLGEVLGEVWDDLSAPVLSGQGALLVRGATTYVDTIADLQALDTGELEEGQQVSVKDVGLFVYEAGGWRPQSVNVRSGQEFPDNPKENQLFIIEPDELHYYTGSRWQLLVSDALLQSYVDSASAQADRAEAARDAAFVNADVYPDTATGLAAVAEGEQFQVLSASGTEYIRYRKDSGTVATELPGRYPSSKLVTDAVTDVKSNISSIPGDDVYQAVDANLELVHRIDHEGKHWIPGLPESLQDMILSGDESNSSAVLTAFPADLVAITDAEDEVTLRQAESGEVYIPGMPTSIQEGAGYTGRMPDISSRTTDDFFSPTMYPYMTHLSVSGLKFAPFPLNLYPMSRQVPDQLINSLEAQQPYKRLSVDSPYGKDDKVVHPYVIEFVGGFRGYRYLMCITPYTAEAHENPVIYGSNDLEEFSMLTGFQQPLATPSSGGAEWISDNALFHDPLTGELGCLYRRSDRYLGKGNTLECRTTRDGVVWSDIKTLIPWTMNAEGSSSHLSPAILYHPESNLFHLWSVEGSNGRIRHYTAPTIDSEWQYESTSFFPGTWHIEVKYIGSKFVMLRNKIDPGSNFMLSISEDGDSWVHGTHLMMPGENDALYKASMLPVVRENTLKLQLLWTTNHAANPENHRRMFSAVTNTYEFEEL